MAQIRLLIVNKYPMIRQSIRTVVCTEPAILVVGEAGSESKAVDQVKYCQPDVVLLDFFRLSESGIETIAKIKHHCPGSKIIILTQVETPAVINAALEAGADGYLLKDTGPRSMLQAIQAVHQGDMPLHPRVARHLFQRREEQNDLNPTTYLTEREKEVLQLLTQGLSNKSIAQALNLAEGTVKGHVNHILAKLQVANRAEAAVQAVQRGLVPSN